MAKSSNLIMGKSEAGTVFAAFDAAARFSEARIADTRFGALLSPFKSEADARAALAAADAEVVGGAS
jgi:hypothetical protein